MTAFVLRTCALRQAFRLTVKKLEKYNAPSDKHGEDLGRERIDQVSVNILTIK